VFSIAALDVEPTDVDALVCDLGVQRLEVVALRGQDQPPGAVRIAVQGAGSLCAQDRTIAPGDHGREELPHQRKQRVDAERHEVVDTLGFWQMLPIRIMSTATSLTRSRRRPDGRAHATGHPSVTPMKIRFWLPGRHEIDSGLREPIAVLAQ
jgi:hypothetical protein